MEVNVSLIEARNANWKEAPLSALMRHIVEKHHAFCRQEAAHLDLLFTEALHKHGALHAELQRMHPVFKRLLFELNMHLVKEEDTLFPLITRMEEAAIRHEDFPKLTYGTIQHPIQMMFFEHDDTNAELNQIRQFSGNYEVPPGVDPTYHALYEALKQFDDDMQEHVYLEDRLLFPRIVMLEHSNRVRPAKGS